MNEITELLESWKEDGITNPDALNKLHQAALLMVDKIEQLESEIANLKGGAE